MVFYELQKAGAESLSRIADCLNGFTVCMWTVKTVMLSGVRLLCGT
jgi:hypothetical protein